MPADTPPPTDLVVQPLVRGDGAQVEAGQVVTVRYTGVRWSDGEVFDSTWAEGTAPSSVIDLGAGGTVSRLRNRGIRKGTRSAVDVLR